MLDQSKYSILTPPTTSGAMVIDSGFFYLQLASFSLSWLGGYRDSSRSEQLVTLIPAREKEDSM